MTPEPLQPNSTITLHGVTVEIRAIVAGWVVCKGEGKHFVKRIGELGEWKAEEMEDRNG